MLNVSSFQLLSSFILSFFLGMTVFYAGGCRPFLHSYQPVTLTELQSRGKEPVEVLWSKWDMFLSRSPNKHIRWAGQLRIRINQPIKASQLTAKVPFFLRKHWKDLLSPLFHRAQWLPKVYGRMTCPGTPAVHLGKREVTKAEKEKQYSFLGRSMLLSTREYSLVFNKAKPGCILDVSFGAYAKSPISNRIAIPLLYSLPIRKVQFKVWYPSSFEMDTSFQDMGYFWKLFREQFQQSSPQQKITSWIASKAEIPEPLYIKHDSYLRIVELTGANLPAWKEQQISSGVRRLSKGLPYWLVQLKSSAQGSKQIESSWKQVAKSIQSIPLWVKQAIKKQQNKGMLAFPALGSSHHPRFYQEYPSLFYFDSWFVYTMTKKQATTLQSSDLVLTKHTQGHVILGPNKHIFQPWVLVLHPSQPFLGMQRQKQKQTCLFNLHANITATGQLVLSSQQTGCLQETKKALVSLQDQLRRKLCPRPGKHCTHSSFPSAIQLLRWSEPVLTRLPWYDYQFPQPLRLEIKLTNKARNILKTEKARFRTKLEKHCCGVSLQYESKTNSKIESIRFVWKRKKTSFYSYERQQYAAFFREVSGTKKRILGIK